MKKKMTVALAAAVLVGGGLVMTATPAFAAASQNFPGYSCPQGSVFVSGSTQFGSTYQVTRSGVSKTASYSDGINYMPHILYSGYAVSTSESIITTGASISNGRANCAD